MLHMVEDDKIHVFYLKIIQNIYLIKATFNVLNNRFEKRFSYFEDLYSKF